MVRKPNAPAACSATPSKCRSRAEDALRRGDFAAAREAQQQAMSSLAGPLHPNSPASTTRTILKPAEPSATSAISSAVSTMATSGYGDNVQIPEEMDRQKAREILDEIRRRAGNRALTREELEYLNRLLERF
jgi:3-oxoacyl-ACP reductase-like protein